MRNKEKIQQYTEPKGWYVKGNYYIEEEYKTKNRNRNYE